MHEYPVEIPNLNLKGILQLPTDCRGLIIFAHGSGSSHLSPRNQYTAKIFQTANFATLLFDLLTIEEEAKDELTSEYRFNIPLLAKRLLVVSHWVSQQSHLRSLALGYFGASTGGGAAILAASTQPTVCRAVVSRGGRPDLAGDDALMSLKTPTLLLVGGEDQIVIELNEQAFKKIHCEKQIEIIPDATHLFEEPGKLLEMTNLAKKWFEKYLF